MATLAKDSLYICPGEAHPISRAVHLSRLAAYFPKCRDCSLRHDTGQLSQQTVDRIETTQRRAERRSLFVQEGVRGVYLNELDRLQAGKIAAALAGLLWEDSPRIGRTESPRKTTRRAGPTVVVGHDERPSSPDIVTAAAAALRLAGCQVIDIQATTKPCCWFAVEHLQAAAGVYVTGAGCDPSWTGMDFVLRGALPMSGGKQLDLLQKRFQRHTSRPARHAEPQRMFRAVVPYEASLWRHFHALRPLRVCCGCASRLVTGTLERIFDTLPCNLFSVTVPRRARNLADPIDADVVRLGAAVREHDAHLGVLIDDDGQRCGFLDERGALVPSRDVFRAIAELMQAEHPSEPIVIEESAHSDLAGEIESAGQSCFRGGTTLAEMSTAMREHHALLGGGDSGYFWLRESFPACDAVLTLAQVLSTLSRSDESFSAVVGTAESEEVKESPRLELVTLDETPPESVLLAE